MKYRSKLYLSLVGVAVVGTALALAVIYWVTSRKLYDQTRVQVASIAATAADLVNGDLLKNIHDPEDRTSPDYRLFQEQLRKIKGANERSDVYVKYVYTLSPLPNQPNTLTFGVDADVDPEPVGEVYNYSDSKNIIKNLCAPYADTDFTKDAWGVWLSGFAPIYNSEGKYVATLGLDANAGIILAKLHRLMLYSLLALLISILLALLFGYFLARVATTSLRSLYKTVLEIGHGNLQAESHLNTHDEFNTLSLGINEMLKGLRERERLKLNFARYVSQYILEKILKSDQPLKLEGERKKVTVLISDIRQFTHLAETLPPEEVISILNRYFERMIDVIFQNNGTLDKFMGDGIRVLFGAPIEDPAQEKNAVLCALKMQEEVKKFSPSIEVGIGIHTGHVIVGNIGSEKRMEFTAIGDTITVARGLEEATKTYKEPILLSEETYVAIKDQFKMKQVAPNLYTPVQNG